MRYLRVVIETESRMWLPGAKWELGSYCLTSIALQFHKMKRVMQMDGNDGGIIM